MLNSVMANKLFTYCNTHIVCMAANAVLLLFASDWSVQELVAGGTVNLHVTVESPPHTNKVMVTLVSLCSLGAKRTCPLLPNPPTAGRPRRPAAIC